MMTHKKIILKCKKLFPPYKQHVTIEEIITSGGDLYFDIGGYYKHKLFDKFENGDKIVATVRVNVDSKTRRRYFISAVLEDDYNFEAESSDEDALPASCTPEIIKNDSSVANENEPADLSFLNEADTGVNNSETKPQFHITNQQYEIFDSVTRMMNNKPSEPAIVAMIGKPGYGKSTIGKIYAEEVGMDYYRHDCASVRDPEEWFGYREAVDGSTVFYKSDFIKVAEKGNCVIVLDEFNRVEPYLHNSIYHMLEPDAEMIVHNEKIKIGKNVVFIITINVGYGHSGTFSLDTALINRASLFCEVGPLGFEAEKQVLISYFGISEKDSSEIVKCAASVRSLDVIECSTRTTLHIARAVSSGLTVRAAFEHIVVQRCKSDITTVEHLKSIIDCVNSDLSSYRKPKKSKFNVKLKKD